MPAKKAAERKRRTITAEHREAISVGRAQNVAVTAYLDSLAYVRPRRGRPPEEIRVAIAEVAAELAATDSIPGRLLLVQQRLNLEAELEEAEGGGDAQAAELETSFVEHALGYSERRGISWRAWREIGVPARVLRAAGIPVRP